MVLFCVFQQNNLSLSMFWFDYHQDRIVIFVVVNVQTFFLTAFFYYHVYMFQRNDILLCLIASFREIFLNDSCFN